MKVIIKDMKKSLQEELLKVGLLLFVELETGESLQKVYEAPNPTGNLDLTSLLLPLTTAIQRRKQ